MRPHALFISLLIALTAIGCNGAAVGEEAPASRIPSPSGAAADAPGATRYQVSDRSTATVRVRERLASLPAPNEAVLTVSGASGRFAVREDGSFTPDSKIVVTVSTIRSDQNNRDNYVRQTSLEVSRFPTAEFVPKRTSGLTLPLPTSGEISFRLTGDMTIHGVTKEVTFDITARQSGAELIARAEANPAWKFGDFGMRVPTAAVVLSVDDEIKFTFELIATREN